MSLIQLDTTNLTSLDSQANREDTDLPFNGFHLANFRLKGKVECFLGIEEGKFVVRSGNNNPVTPDGRRFVTAYNNFELSDISQISSVMPISLDGLAALGEDLGIFDPKDNRIAIGEVNKIKFLEAIRDGNFVEICFSSKSSHNILGLIVNESPSRGILLLFQPEFRGRELPVVIQEGTSLDPDQRSKPVAITLFKSLGLVFPENPDLAQIRLAADNMLAVLSSANVLQKALSKRSRLNAIKGTYDSQPPKKLEDYVMKAKVPESRGESSELVLVNGYETDKSKNERIISIKWSHKQFAAISTTEGVVVFDSENKTFVKTTLPKSELIAINPGGDVVVGYEKNGSDKLNIWTSDGNTFSIKTEPLQSIKWENFKLYTQTITGKITIYSIDQINKTSLILNTFQLKDNGPRLFSELFEVDPIEVYWQNDRDYVIRYYGKALYYFIETSREKGGTVTISWVGEANKSGIIDIAAVKNRLDNPEVFFLYSYDDIDPSPASRNLSNNIRNILVDIKGNVFLINSVLRYSMSQRNRNKVDDFDYNYGDFKDLAELKLPIDITIKYANFNKKRDELVVLLSDGSIRIYGIFNLDRIESARSRNNPSIPVILKNELRLNFPVKSVKFSPDGTKLFIVGDNILTVWEHKVIDN